MKKTTDLKGWIRGNTNIGPVLKSQPATCKINSEWKSEFESVNKDTSHSWARISHGLNNLVTDLIDQKYDDKRFPQRRRKCLRLQADPRLKQNREDPPLLFAHLQGFSYFRKKMD